MKSSPALEPSVDISKQLSMQKSDKKKKVWVSGTLLHTTQVNVWVFKMSMNLWNLDIQEHLTHAHKQLDAQRDEKAYSYIQLGVCRWV